MKKLSNIKGYWDMSYGYYFDENRMWEGKILVEEDGWFEGIVRDINSSYTDDRLVFGVYHPNKIIELFKVSPSSISSPLVFRGIQDKKGYEGAFEVCGLFGFALCGVSRIITEKQELTENMDSKVRELETKIANYKEKNMDKFSKDLYEGAFAIKKQMCKSLLLDYQNRMSVEDFTPKTLIKK